MLVVAGDSFTYGSECLDLSNRWSKTLADCLGLSECNLAKPGTSNSRNVRVIIEQCLSNPKPNVVSMLWTFPSRHEYMLNYKVGGTRWIEPSHEIKLDNDVGPIDPTELLNNKNNYIREFSETLYRHTHDEEYDAYLMYKEMQYLQMFCETQSIKYVPLFTFNDIWGYGKPYYMKYPWMKYMLSSINPFIDFDGLGYIDWCRDKGFEFGQYMHPMDEANQAAGKYIASKIND